MGSKVVIIGPADRWRSRTAAALERAGYTVITVDEIAHLRNGHLSERCVIVFDWPDARISDIAEAVTQVRVVADASVPLLVCFSPFSSVEVIHARNAGADAILHKHCDNQELLHLLNRVLHPEA